jgi:hypothetical protein
MKKYEYYRIKKLEQQMEGAGVDKEIIDQVMEGGEKILRSTTPEKKADWMRGAMIRMDRLLDSETRHDIREACACCLGGKRIKISRGIAKENKTLEERIKAANEANYVGSVAMVESGVILVRFNLHGPDYYRCVCLPKAREPISITYCYCCGGHVKHHLQIALGRSLDCTVSSSALSSGGKSPCSFSFRIKE